MNFNIPKGLVSKIIETRDFKTVMDNQIKLSYFSGDDKNVFQYIMDQFKANNEVPTARVFQKKFPRYGLDRLDDDTIGNEESLLFWCNEMRNRVKHNTIASMVDETAVLLDGMNTEEAYEVVKKKIAYIESEIMENVSVDITDTQDRKERYERKKITQGMVGIPTGIPYLDYLTKGVVEHTLTSLIAQTAVGKSWFFVMLGCNFVLEGYKVLQLLTEMSSDIMRDRYEALLCSRLYGEFNYNDFKSGKLSRQQEENYFKFLEKDLPGFEKQSLVLDTATSPMGVSAQIEKYRPDIVLIDSAYLMEDDQKAHDDWLRITHITRDLKKLTKRVGTPIWINAQADKNTSRKTGPELGSISYSQSVGMDSDNVFAIFRDETMIKDREMKLKILKQREGGMGTVTLNWDFSKMDFSEIYSEPEDDNTREVGDD